MRKRKRKNKEKAVSHKRDAASFFFLKRGDVTFLSPNKKVTKEVGIGEALSRLLPQAKPPSPMYLSRRALGIPVDLNGQNLQSYPAKRGRRLPLAPPCRLSSAPSLQSKSRDTFCLNRSYSKMLRSCPERSGRFLRGATGTRGSAAFSALLSRILLVLFLAKQEKNITPAPIETPRLTKPGCPFIRMQ